MACCAIVGSGDRNHRLHPLSSKPLPVPRSRVHAGPRGQAGCPDGKAAGKHTAASKGQVSSDADEIRPPAEKETHRIQWPPNQSQMDLTLIWLSVRIPWEGCECPECPSRQVVFQPAPDCPWIWRGAEHLNCSRTSALSSSSPLRGWNIFTDLPPNVSCLASQCQSK